MLGTACVGRRDEEREVGRAVRGAEVDLGRQPGEPDRGLVDVWRATVGDGDAAGQSGGGLRLARHRGCDQTVAIGGTSGGGEPGGKQADDGLLVAAGVDVEGDEVSGDD